jgi:hypothetical protein
LFGALFATACGSVKAGPDAKVTPPIDADLRDADLTGTATVVTQTHFAGGTAVGTLQGMVDVVSTLPNGMVHDMGKTDTSGHLSIKVYPGGSVTAIYRHTADLGADLVTFVGAKPNDMLTFGQYWYPPQGTALGAMTLNWPGYAGASNYYMFSPCGGQGYYPTTTTSAGFTMFPGCDSEPMGLIGVALNASYQPAAMSYNFVNFSAGGTGSFAGWQSAATATVSLTGLPMEVTNVYSSYYIIANGGKQSYGYGTSGQTTGGAATLTFPWVNTGERTMATTSMGRPGGYLSTNVYDSLNSMNDTVASPTLPPWVVAGGEGGGALASAAARKIEWLASGTATHSGNVVKSNWQHYNGTTYIPFSWTFITPPDVMSLDLPTLPAIFADTQPHPEDGMYAQTSMLAIPSITGYDGLRQVPEAQLTCPSCAVALNLIPRAIVAGY